jgi:glycosyltransferase involved in cell wall biosynthesis
MKTSVVIRAYNEAAHLGRLLEGISHQTVKDVEIIVVDSGSTDGTPAIAEKGGARLVHIPPEEFTFGRSLNMGLQVARGELAAIASAHVYPVYPDWLERLFEPFNDPQIVLTYGKQRGDERSRFPEQEIFARWYPEQSARPQDHPFCNNANAAIRRSAWQAQPYDETLTGLEDLAWAGKAQAVGGRIAYIAEAEVVHCHNETPRGVFNRYRREAMAFKRIYPEAHFNAYDFVRNLSASIAFDLLHASRQGVLLRNLASIFWFRWSQFRGTFSGYRHASLVTPELRQTFYYHTGWERGRAKAGKRDVDPIRYND